MLSMQRPEGTLQKLDSGLDSGLDHGLDCLSHISEYLKHLSPYVYETSYSLAPSVSFDLLQCLYKLEHHTVLCCSAYIRYMHCGPDICTAGLSVMIIPGPQAINQLKHPGVLTNTQTPRLL